MFLRWSVGYCLSVSVSLCLSHSLSSLAYSSFLIYFTFLPLSQTSSLLATLCQILSVFLSLCLSSALYACCPLNLSHTLHLFPCLFHSLYFLSLSHTFHLSYTHTVFSSTDIFHLSLTLSHIPLLLSISLTHSMSSPDSLKRLIFLILLCNLFFFFSISP